MIFTRHFVTHENHWQIASISTKKSLFTVTPALFYISHVPNFVFPTLYLQISWHSYGAGPSASTVITRHGTSISRGQSLRLSDSYLYASINAAVICSSNGCGIYKQSLFTPQPSGLEGYCCHGPGGRAGGRLPNLRNPYLCNRLTDFLDSKFCGIV